MTEKEKKEWYAKLESRLEEVTEWPSIYMFKFIIPADNKRLAQVENLFNSKESEITTRTSRKGNFISVTVKEMMMSPHKVVERYQSAENIEDIISL